MASLEHVGSIAQRMLEGRACHSDILDTLCRLGLKAPGASSCDHAPIETSTCSEPEPVGSTCRWTALIDGSAKPHGAAGYGVLISCSCGCLQVSLSNAFPYATSSQAECLACLAALKWAAERKAQSFMIITDWPPLARHLRGKAQLKSPRLRPLLEVAQAFARLIPEFSIEYRPRSVVNPAHLLARTAVKRARNASNARHVSAARPPDA